MIYFAIAILLISAMLFIENRLIVMCRHEKFGDGIRIMHVSDIHKDKKGADNCRISQIAEKKSPDMIFITGDLISRNETDFKSAEILLNRLCEVAPVYMVFGNHEQSIGEQYVPELEKMFENTKVQLLNNCGKYVDIKGRKFYICGVVPKYTTYKKNDGYRNLDTFSYKDMTDIMGGKPDGNILLLAHNPLWADVYAEWGADYTFSGHVHGGVVRIFGKGILSPERKLFPKYSKGVYTVGKMKLCVSGGIGKLRLFNPPEIVFYKL